MSLRAKNRKWKAITKRMTYSCLLSARYRGHNYEINWDFIDISRVEKASQLRRIFQSTRGMRKVCKSKNEKRDMEMHNKR